MVRAIAYSSPANNDSGSSRLSGTETVVTPMPFSMSNCTSVGPSTMPDGRLALRGSPR